MARESQIQIHRTEAVGATPSGLTSGELAVNLKDQKLFVGLSSGGYLTFNSVLNTSTVSVVAGNGINVVSEAEAGIAGISPPSTAYIVTLNPDITGHTLNITGNAIFSGYDRGVTFNGRVSIGNGNPETGGGWGLYKNPDAYNTTPSSGVAGLVDFTKTIAATIDYANRVGGKVAELLPANAFQESNTTVRTVLDIDSITGAGMFLAKAYSSTGQGNLIGQYLGNLGGVPPLCYKNAPGDPPQTAVCTGVERALLVENINVNFQALGLIDTQIGTPFRTLIQYGTWIDNVQSPAGLGGVPAASGTYETTFDKYVRTGYLVRGGTGTSGGATGTYIWSQWKNLVETTDDLGKYGVATVNGGTGDISITGAAGATGAIVVRSTSANTHIIDARIATNSLTGVASFNSAEFIVSPVGSVSLSTGNTFEVNTAAANKFNVALGGKLSITASGAIRSIASSPSEGNATVTLDNRVATSSLTGVASFDPRHFALGASGHVSLTGPYQVTGDTVVAGNNISVTRSNNQVTITNTGVTGIGFGIDAGLTGKINLTGAGAASSQRITVSGNQVTLDNRIASISVTGVAAFNTTQFSVSAPGVVSLLNGSGFDVRDSLDIKETVSLGGTLTLTASPSGAIRTTVSSPSSGNATVVFDARMASLTVTGVASFDRRHFALGASGHVSLTGTYQVTGDTVVAGNSISVSRSNNQATITNTGVTGIGFGIDAGLTGRITLTGSAITVLGNTITFTSGSGGVPSVNGDATAITITGAGNNAAVVVKRTGSGTHLIDARMASLTVTGVASFDTRHFALGASGHVSLTGTYQVTGDTVVAGNSISVVRSNNQATITNTGVTGIGFSVDGGGLGLTGRITLTGSAITVSGNLITFTSGSGGVPSVNGDATAITITGAGNNAAIVVKRTGSGTHLIDARMASLTVTGVASFDTRHFALGASGHVSLTGTYQVTGDTVVAGNSISVSRSNNQATITNTGVTGIGFGIDAGLTGKINLTAGSGVTITRSGNQITIGANASGGDTVFGDSGSVVVNNPSANNKYVTVKNATSVALNGNGTVASMQPNDGKPHGITGVATFDHAHFTVNSDLGIVRLTNPAFAFSGSGFGGVTNDDGSLSYMYFDPANLTAYTGTYDSKKLNYVLIYDNDETGLVKAKRASVQNFFAENSGLITSSTSGQLTNASKKSDGFGNDTLEIGVVLGNVAAGQEGLVKGASAYAYIETNTIRSFNGLTGAVTAVGSINGCTAAVVITGSASEIEVLNTCPNIVIGLPDNVTISNLNVLSGATFGGNISAKNVVTSVNGATGPITNVAKTDVNNEFASAQTFNSNVLVSDSIITVYDSAVEHSIILSPSTDRIRFYDDGFGNSLDLYAGGNFNNQVIAFPGSNTTLAGLAVSQTFTDTNTFNSLTIFASGLSASGATFANDIKVNGVNIGLGSGNVASNLGIGKGALSGNSGGLFNTAIGSGAMEIGTNSYSVAFGYNALHSCTGGGINNVALGSNTMATISSASSNVAIGSNSSQQLIDGNFNISIGGESLANNANGSSNLAIGHQALYANSTSNNIGIGYQALYTNDEGQQNTAIGYEALKSITTTGSAERNTAIGYQAGRWRGTGTSVISNRLNSANDSIFIGWRARSSADAQTNQIVIGNNTLGGGSNTTTIGTTASTDATIYGKLHGTNGVSGPTASFTSLTVSENTTLGNAATDTTTIHGAKIVNEGVYANGSLRTANISFANGQVQTLTGVGTGATGVTAIYFTGAPSTGAASVTAIITNGGLMTGAGMTSWGGNIKWPGGTKPLLTSSGVDVVSFVTPDAGTTIYGFVGGLGFS